MNLKRKIVLFRPALASLFAAAVACLAGGDCSAAPAVVPQRGVAICVASDAPAQVRAAARSVLAAAGTQPLLASMSAGAPPSALTDTRVLFDAPAEARAYNHIILIGLPDDPMIAQAWQRAAKVEDGGFYVFGYGHLRGDIGYIESDRNPYLHGAAIKIAPFETEIVTITGSTPAGVAIAASAFLKEGLLNGVVAASGWIRPRATILDRDPLPPGFALPAWIPARAGHAQCLGVTAAGEDEYRGVLADAGVEPREIWRVKYYHSGDWDAPGAAAAFAEYAAGLHRMAYGNTLWCARFASTSEAAAAAPQIAAAARIERRSGYWTGQQPPYYVGRSAGSLTLWTTGAWVFMSTLPDDDTSDLRAQISAR